MTACILSCYHVLVVFVSFTQQQYDVSEDAGPMVVGVQLNRELQRRIAVQVVLTGNSAEGKAQ